MGVQEAFDGFQEATALIFYALVFLYIPTML